MTAMSSRDDRQILNNLPVSSKILLGFSMYIPFSWLKKIVYTFLGANVGKNVYFGPGSLLISHDFHNITIGENVFFAPGVLVQANHLSIGSNSTIGYQCLLVGDNLSIGSGCNISNRSFIESSYAPVTIGDFVTIAASVIISSHDGAYRQTHNFRMKMEPVSIKDRAFIGNNAIILPGIIIGEKAIVGAGAVVTKNVDAMTVVAGIPARKIKNCIDNFKDIDTGTYI